MQMLIKRVPRCSTVTKIKFYILKLFCEAKFLWLYEPDLLTSNNPISFFCLKFFLIQFETLLGKGNFDQVK